MWQQSSKIKTLFFGRIIGCGFSSDEKSLLLITYDKVVRWSLGSGQQLWREDVTEGVAGYDIELQVYHAGTEAITIVGLFGGSAIHVHENGWRLSVMPEGSQVIVRHPKLGSQIIRYDAFSGDWVVASFSESGKYLLTMEPNWLALYEYAPGLSTI